MKKLVSHHDGHGLAESIGVYAMDEPGPGGAYHQYAFFVETDPAREPERDQVGEIQFQKGPRNVAGSTPGVIEGAVLAVLIDRLEAFQAGDYACGENAAALEHLHSALGWIKQRAHSRAKRGVLGSMNK